MTSVEHMIYHGLFSNSLYHDHFLVVFYIVDRHKLHIPYVFLFQLLKDKQLLFIICALLALDSVLILLWVVIDPMHREIRNFTKEVNTDIHFSEHHCFCLL